MRIFTKFLLTLMTLVSILLGALYYFVQWNLDRGLLNYVNQKELQSLQSLTDNLSRFYQEQGSWAKIVASVPEHVQSGLAPPDRHRPSPRHLPPHSRRNTGEPYWRLLIALSQQGLSYPDNSDDVILKRLDERQEPPFKVALLNAQGERLLGRYDTGFNRKAIYLDGDIVGFVALPENNALAGNFEIEFLAHERQTLIISFVSLFIVILLLSLAASRHFIRPISKLKRAIIAVNKGELETRLQVTGKDELAILARNFNDLAATLAHNADSRKRWLADVSHELRTPLAIIKGEIEAMQDGVRALNSAGLTSLSAEVIHLQKLINDLNEVSNAEIGAMRYDKVKLDLTTLLQQSCQSHALLLAEKGITLHLPDNLARVSVWGDVTRLNQLLDNIFSNSGKYTDADGQVHVELNVANQQVIVDIHDSAPGVPDFALDKLFEHLYRVDSSRNRKTGGSGLGLALCKHIVHAHQGAIEAKHSTYGGLQIRIQLPII